ncbi:glycerate kinase [Bradyrhizobium sp. BR13661]|jgi:glycerate 2-kinase|uniref:glycerate kinase type-2 family protein n=1 Tax=Bradyrhizobium sp. BR13661 TaxID=2940622 RepID=UPI0024741DE5|nr:glycerate kinase [Bradyrhizobium sp. BR13661]MDH6257571.1 glycerate 2-kinase [Bradyrhizobium sp. BR13661]
MASEPRRVLHDMFEAAVAAASPSLCLPRFLPKPPKGRTVVVGAGKAAAAMASTVEKHWQGPLEGLVVTRYGHGAPCERIEVIEAAHPVPDLSGLEAAQRILDKVRGLAPEDLVLCLMSGGASSLLALPAEGIALEDKQAINRSLLRSGAHIGEMNCVRKHLSAIKGGKLAVAAAPARVVSLIISDVPGDDLSVIGSGPTVPDMTTRADAIAVLEKYRIEAPRSVIRHLEATQAQTSKFGNSSFANVANVCVARPQDAMEAAARIAHDAGFRPLILGNAIEGEARDVALVHAGIARQVAAFGQPIELPCALISGGETTVTVRGSGRGGRNAEFLLSLAVALNGQSGIAALAADTDGIDGSEDNAGAFLLPDTISRAAKAGLNLNASLANNDAYTIFAGLDDLLVTGPTRTNVNDFRAILVYERS